jgi:hypothetical protein
MVTILERSLFPFPFNPLSKDGSTGTQNVVMQGKRLDPRMNFKEEQEKLHTFQTILHKDCILLVQITYHCGCSLRTVSLFILL